VLQGTIDEFPLIDVLGILQARNKTGRLEIERQAGRGLIYVRLGEPYYAESSLTRSLIGQKLVDIGAITDMQLRKALDRQAESGERLGQILLTHGVISADHVAQAVISQIKDALADLLAWEAGEFRWETGAEVEVEVPLFGADAGSIGEGANPLAPHVIPVNTQEPDTAPDRAEPEAVVAQTDFPRGGTTMTGNEVTATPNESFPDAGQDHSLEVVHSSPEVVDDVADEETEPHTEAEVTESESEIQEPEPAAELDDSEPEPEAEIVHDNESEAEPETEPENEPELETDEPDDESESEPESVSDYDEGESEPETEPVSDYNESEVEGSPLTIDSEARAEVPDEFHVPRVIRSQPAPELDEEFEAVFVTAHPSYEVEPVAKPVDEAPHFDPPLAVDPVFGTDAFTPIAPATEFDHPTFVPDNGSADPVFDHGNFEPLPENSEPYDSVAETSDAVPLEPVAESLDEVPETSFESLPDSVDDHTDEVPETSFDSLPEIPEPSFPPPFEPVAEAADEDADEAPESSFEPEMVAFDAPPPEPQIETPEPAFEIPLEPVDELPAPDPEADLPEPVPAAPHMPADLMPAVSPPPPPPEAVTADSDEDWEEDVASDEAAEPPGPVAPESLKDIKLDRSSLVRELSDLLR